MPGEQPFTLFASIPKGVVLLFSNWLVFLTESTTSAGGANLWGEVWQRIKIEGKYIATGGLNEDLGEAIGGWMGRKKGAEANLDNLLGNPNSLFIPLDTVVEVETGCKISQGSFVRVRSSDGVFLICQEAYSEGLAGMRGAWGGKWRPEFVAAIQQAIVHRQGTAASPASSAPVTGALSTAAPCSDVPPHDEDNFDDDADDLTTDAPCFDVPSPALVSGVPVSTVPAGIPVSEAPAPSAPQKQFRPFLFGDWETWNPPQKGLLTLAAAILGLIGLFWFPWTCTPRLARQGQTLAETARALAKPEFAGASEMRDSSVFSPPPLPVLADANEIRQQGLIVFWTTERATGWFLLRAALVAGIAAGVIYAARNTA